jgi:hypothetical protein
MLQVITLNNTCLGDKGLNFILRGIQHQMREIEIFDDDSDIIDNK